MGLTVTPVSVFVRAFRSSGVQAITTATETAIVMDGETTDTHVMHDNSTNPSRLTCVRPGNYSICGGANYAGSAAGGVRDIYLRVNGTTRIATATDGNPTLNGTTLSISGMFTLAAGDYVELTTAQNTGGNLNVSAGTGNTWIAMARLP